MPDSNRSDFQGVAPKLYSLNVDLATVATQTGENANRGMLWGVPMVVVGTAAVFTGHAMGQPLVIGGGLIVFGAGSARIGGAVKELRLAVKIRNWQICVRDILRHPAIKRPDHGNGVNDAMAGDRDPARSYPDQRAEGRPGRKYGPVHE